MKIKKLSYKSFGSLETFVCSGGDHRLLLGALAVLFYDTMSTSGPIRLECKTIHFKLITLQTIDSGDLTGMCDAYCIVDIFLLSPVKLE